ncbi:MAG: DNA repair protein RecO [Flavobacteriaceae bacterium]|nr:DNA repair protein RecO [Flavobacteriaceae bacterium]
MIKTKAIVLSAIKYADTSLIMKAYTEEMGLVTYMLKGVLGSKKGKLKAAYFQPLMQLEIVGTTRKNGKLEHIKDVQLDYPYQEIYADPIKRAIAMFLAEVLQYSLQEEEQNKDLFQFLSLSFQFFDQQEKPTNFHLFFMLQLTKYLGFYPQLKQENLPYFDMLEADFIRTPNNNPLLKNEELEAFKIILGTNFDTLAFVRLNQQIRVSLLQKIIVYFELHLQGFRPPKSIDVLRQLFVDN